MSVRSINEQVNSPSDMKEYKQKHKWSGLDHRKCLQDVPLNYKNRYVYK